MHPWFIIAFQVLHMDRNDYYGGDSASLNLIQVHKLPRSLFACVIGRYEIVHVCLFDLSFCFCSFGRDSGEAICLHHIWDPVGITMLT